MRPIAFAGKKSPANPSIPSRNALDSFMQDDFTAIVVNMDLDNLTQEQHDYLHWLKNQVAIKVMRENLEKLQNERNREAQEK
jgi:hypothetical protein